MGLARQVLNIFTGKFSVVGDEYEQNKLDCRTLNLVALPAYTVTARVITANANGALAAQDGVTLEAGDRFFLLKNGTQGARHADDGPYDVTQLGTAGAPFILTPCRDFNLDAKVKSGARLKCTESATYGGVYWNVRAADSITLGTTVLNWKPYMGPGSVAVFGDGQDGVQTLTGTLFGRGAMEATLLAVTTTTNGVVSSNQYKATESILIAAAQLLQSITLGDTSSGGGGGAGGVGPAAGTVGTAAGTTVPAIPATVAAVSAATAGGVGAVPAGTGGPGGNANASGTSQGGGGGGSGGGGAAFATTNGAIGAAGRGAPVFTMSAIAMLWSKLKTDPMLAFANFTVGTAIRIATGGCGGSGGSGGGGATTGGGGGAGATGRDSGGPIHASAPFISGPGGLDAHGGLGSTAGAAVNGATSGGGGGAGSGGGGGGGGVFMRRALSFGASLTTSVVGGGKGAQGTPGTAGGGTGGIGGAAGLSADGGAGQDLAITLPL